MEKEKALELLKKYDYKFHEEDYKTVVKLDFSQRVYLDFSEDDKIKITDRLIGWNFLTGLIRMSLKNAIIYNFIVYMLAGILLCQFKNPSHNLIFIFLFCTVQYIFFSIYYLIKLESFKIQLINNQQD